jgi:hypothetical protein
MGYFVHIIRSGSRGNTYFKLIYSEKLQSRIEARKREKYWKSGVGRELRAKIVKSL